MLSFRRPKECEASRYRHGCDPPQKVQAAPSSYPKWSRPHVFIFKAIPHSTDRVAAIPAELSVSLSFKTKEVRNEMKCQQ
jgi:hypothetical protein